MLLRRLANTLRAENWLGLGLELVLVVAGILLAFQLDRAYQASQDRELEQRYLTRLAEDLRLDSAEIARNTARTSDRLGQLALLDSVLQDPTIAANDPHAFARALEQVTWRSVPTIALGTFSELQSTGRSVLLRSERLRRDLANYYAFIEEQRRLGLGEDDQDRFRVETLGLLSAAHLSAIEDPASFRFHMEPGEAVQVGEAFASRHDAHPWLDRLAKYQVLMGRLSRDFQARNSNLLMQLDSLIAGPR